MKQRKYIYLLILLTFTAMGLWILPSVVKKATYNPDSYPFMYYSSVLGELGMVNFSDKEAPLKDMSGNVYNRSQFDSIMPLLNYRQLMSDGRMPDSIQGYAMTMQLLRAHSVVYRYNPTDISSPEPQLHIMYEAMPKRVGISAPDDVFRFGDRMEFVVADGNYTDHAKSERFNAELTKKGFTFPATGVWGNPNPRKPYDEGYFCLDSRGRLYHVKMVNGRPFVKDTHAGDSIDIAFFAMQEVATKRFYGYLYDKSGNVYILEAGDGSYVPTRLDIAPLDMKKDRMTIMGNVFYWTVTIVRPTGMEAFALDAATMERLEEYRMPRTAGKWDKVSAYLFPYYLDFTSTDSYYVYPRLMRKGWLGFVFNALLAVVALIIFRADRRKMTCSALYVLLTGAAGLLAILLLRPAQRKAGKGVKIGFK